MKDAMECDRESPMPGVVLAPCLPLASCAESMFSFFSVGFLAFVEREGDSVSEIGLTSLLLGRVGLSLRRALAEPPRRFQGVEDLPLND
jgi:hypothetical protein